MTRGCDGGERTARRQVERVASVLKGVVYDADRVVVLERACGWLCRHVGRDGT